MLSSADQIVIYGRAENAGPWYKDDSSGHGTRAISAVGGQGGAGNFNRGGSSFANDVPWNCNRIPLEYFTYSNVPPLQEVCFQALPDIDELDGPCVAAGGDGGPGIIQFHVDDLADLRFPDLEAEFGGTYASGLDPTYVTAPPPLGWKAPGVEPDQMIPFFGRLSMTRSKWVALGLARANAAGGESQVLLRGLGGAVPHTASETVQHEDPLVGPEVLVAPGLTISLDASGLDPADARYRENTALLRLATVLLTDSADASNFAFYSIANAQYDSSTDRFILSMDPSGPNPATFIAGGDILASLVPQTVRLETAGISDAYPAETEVRIEYDATVTDPITGLPSETLSYSATHGDELTTDLDELNLEPWDFFRFQLIFDLDTVGGGVDPVAPRPAVDHLRVQFEF